MIHVPGITRAAGFSVTLIMILSWPMHAQAQPASTLPQDRAAVEACLKQVKANIAADAKIHEDKKPKATTNPAAFLSWSANAIPTQQGSCIGIVNNPCQEQPGGFSTAGMLACMEREHAVWDERLNHHYRRAMQSDDKKYKTALQKAQRAWLAWREARCALPAVENEGGSIVGPLTMACFMEMTAEQAIWFDPGEE